MATTTDATHFLSVPKDTMCINHPLQDLASFPGSHTAK